MVRSNGFLFAAWIPGIRYSFFYMAGRACLRCTLRMTSNERLERSFVVVAHWDRRGAGKSFAVGVSSPRMSVSQEISDTLELIDQLRARFNQPKLYLVGLFVRQLSSGSSRHSARPSVSMWYVWDRPSCMLGARDSKYARYLDSRTGNASAGSESFR